MRKRHLIYLCDDHFTKLRFNKPDITELMKVGTGIRDRNILQDRGLLTVRWAGPQSTGFVLDVVIIKHY